MVLITLTSDFGRSDFYLGQMKGAILRLNKKAQIVDITHDIEPHNVLQGAFVISQIGQHFPKGTIHVGVVDPGVGSARRGIIIKTNHCYFIGPDNGLFSWVLGEQSVKKIVELDAEKIEKISERKISSTFHGRDVFAPAAALISRGYGMEKMGKEIKSWQKMEIGKNKVVYIDHFGNIITTIPDAVAEKFGENRKITLQFKNKKISAKVVKTFSQGKKGEFLLLRGSHNLWEIDLKQDSAADELKATVGDRVKIVQ